MQYRQELVRRHPEWPEAVKQNVLEGKIDLGMSKRQVLSSLGKPIEATGGEDPGQPPFAIWIYHKKYLIFESDQLKSINQDPQKNEKLLS